MPILIPIHRKAVTDGGIDLFDANGKWFTYCSSHGDKTATAQEKADLIERSVNNYGNLLAALRNAEEALTDDPDIQHLESVKLAQAIIENALVATTP